MGAGCCRLIPENSVRPEEGLVEVGGQPKGMVERVGISRGPARWLLPRSFDQFCNISLSPFWQVKSWEARSDSPHHCSMLYHCCITGSFSTQMIVMMMIMNAEKVKDKKLLDKHFLIFLCGSLCPMCQINTTSAKVEETTNVTVVGKTARMASARLRSSKIRSRTRWQGWY